MLYLQHRWKIEKGGVRYYGLRNKPNMLKNFVKLSKKQLNVVKSLPKELSEKELRLVRKLTGSVIVEKDKLKTEPNSLKEAKFCKNCAANDFIISGLEFDGEGLCPMCQTKEETENLKSVVPIVNSFPRSKKSRFDVALFYTGGKDSTYLLHYLAKVQGLRVLALTWEIPFASDSAKQSIENAKKHFPSVEFLTRKVADNDLKKIYAKLYSLSGNTCACPSLAYVLFYPELVENKVPYLVVGNETAQIRGLYYNGMAPKYAYTFHENRFLNALINVARIVTFRPPYKNGQFHTIATMKQLAYGDSVFKKAAGYENALVSNVVSAIREIDRIVVPLKKAIRRSNWSGNIPRFVQVDFDEISGGKYDWKKIKNKLVSECGWVAPNECCKGLHTSCKIEKCKEYSQFIRFRNMQSAMIPFSSLEISLASRDGNVTKEQAIEEMDTALGFSLEEIPECELMKEYLKSE